MINNKEVSCEDCLYLTWKETWYDSYCDCDYGIYLEEGICEKFESRYKE